MKENKKVSIIIPAYNRRELVRRAILSCLSQTYKNIEVIVIDDCSEEDIKGIIDEIGDERIIYHRNPRRMGPAYSRNMGLYLSSGEFIAFLDSDDWFLEDKIRLQVELMEKSDIGINYTFAFLLLPDGKREKWELELKGFVYPEMLCSYFKVPMTPTVMVRSEVIEKVGKFDVRLFPLGEDTDFFLRVCKFYKIDFIPEYLVVIDRSTEARITQNLNQIPLWALENRVLIISKFSDDIRKLCGREKLKWLYTKNYLMAYAKGYIKTGIKVSLLSFYKTGNIKEILKIPYLILTRKKIYKKVKDWWL